MTAQAAVGIFIAVPLFCGAAEEIAWTQDRTADVTRYRSTLHVRGALRSYAFLPNKPGRP
jgi:hypothetical protein